MWIDSDLYNALRIAAPDDWNLEDFIEVQIEEDDFLKIKETLTRIGVSTRKNDNCLYQTCHILHKQGRYYIVHFKELFILDGRQNNLSIEDVIRRNVIAHLLESWGLVKILNGDVCGLKYLQNHEPLIDAFTKTAKEDWEGVDRNLVEMYYFVSHKTKILRYHEKQNWTLVPKYKIGN